MHAEGYPLNPLLTATELSRWADDRRAQGDLPLLVRRLVAASVDADAADFPAGDSVARPGYDGVLESPTGCHPVPAGRSVWEMGTNARPREKADADFRTRVDDPLGEVPATVTFVFVTPRRWPGKAKWAAARRAAAVWRDVRVIDADDLEQWLDRAPAVGAWARRLVGGVPDGVRDLDDVWDSWAARTAPPLVPGLFTGGREAAVERVLAWLAGPPAVFRVVAATADEAAGFVAAVIVSAAGPIRDRVLSRGLLVETPDAWRALAAQKTPLLLVAAPAGADAARAVAAGHHVALVYGNDSAGVAADVRLGHIRRSDLLAALRQMGLSDGAAREIGAESRGRVEALVDLLGGGMVAPHWAAPGVAAELVPLFLAGSWSRSAGDMAAVARLARLTPDDLATRLARWAAAADPPVRLVGGMWEWVSRRRAWPHLARHVSPADAALFRDLAAEVLGERDADPDPDPARPWAAAFRGRRRHSDALRAGLAGTLALGAAGVGPGDPGPIPAGLAAGVVTALFDPAPDLPPWLGLAAVLPLLAEAAPEAFLRAVERGPVADAAVRTAIFPRVGPLATGLRCNLLWALETLAWSPDYLSPAAVALAGLAAADPGGATGNRPVLSLREIFLSWKPGTAAGVDTRLAALDAVLRAWPGVAFDLGLRLLPRLPDHSSPTARPRWRTWADAVADEAPSAAAVQHAYDGVFGRLVGWAGTDPASWAALLGAAAFAADQWGVILARVEELRLNELAAAADDGLRRTVRQLLHRVRTTPGAYRGLTDGLAARLDTVYARLEPPHPVRREAWLFDRHPTPPWVPGADWEPNRRLLDLDRWRAVRTLAASGTAPVRALAAAAEDPAAVGRVLGESNVSDAAIFDELCECVESESETLRAYAAGVAVGRFRRGEWPWADRVFAAVARGWRAGRVGAFARLLPWGAAAWGRVEALGEEAAAAYWRAGVPWVADPHRDAPRAVETLLARGRPVAAFTLARNCVGYGAFRDALPADLLGRVLAAVTAVARGDIDSDETLPADPGLGDHLGEMLDAIGRAGAADEADLAATELTWLAALEHTPRGPVVLHRLLARDSSLFIAAVRLAYLPRTGPVRERLAIDPATDLARQAGRLVRGWHGYPGRAADGSINPAAVCEWVDSARRAFCDSGHAAIGDQIIGDVLARIPPGPGGGWPAACVRDLLEDVGSDAVDAGFYMAVVNNRGVTVRAPDDGGNMERQLEAEYAARAAALAAYPRAAGVVRRLADFYARDARDEDAHRDLNEYP